MSRIKVIVEGPQASETARVKHFIETTWKFGPAPPRSLLGLEVEFLTRAPAPASISTLEIKIDSAQVEAATKALNDLADVAARARQAIEAL